LLPSAVRLLTEEAIEGFGCQCTNTLLASGRGWRDCSLAGLLGAVGPEADDLSIRSEGKVSNHSDVVATLGHQFAGSDFPDADLPIVVIIFLKLALTTGAGGNQLAVGAEGPAHHLEVLFVSQSRSGRLAGLGINDLR